VVQIAFLHRDREIFMFN